MKRPNVILMTSHDIGRRLHCYGHAEVHSPALDKLAADGAIFRSAFCTQAQCSPSRASLYTGRYPHSNGVMGLVSKDFAWDLHPDEQHLAGRLKSDGYRTALAGLQHETGRLSETGFDEIDGGTERWAASVADASEQFLAKFAADPDHPFYLQVGFFEGHRIPGHPNHEWGPMAADAPDSVVVPGYLKDDPGTRAEFAQLHGSIRSMDAAVERILATVDACGFRDNTIVLFTADHGISFPRAKTTCYDPGLEVALLMRGPGVPAGRDVRDLVSNVDILPTLMDLLGLPCPETVQGQSFAGLFGGRDYQARTHVFSEMTYHNYIDPLRCVRSETHKLIVNFMPCATIYNCTEQWRPVSTPAFPPNPKNAIHPVVELYDLEKDPWERNNCVDDPDYADIRAHLLSVLTKQIVETEDPIRHGPPLPRRFHDALALLGLEPPPVTSPLPPDRDKSRLFERQNPEGVLNLL